MKNQVANVEDVMRRADELASRLARLDKFVRIDTLKDEVRWLGERLEMQGRPVEAQKLRSAFETWCAAKRSWGDGVSASLEDYERVLALAGDRAEVSWEWLLSLGPLGTTGHFSDEMAEHMRRIGQRAVLRGVLLVSALRIEQGADVGAELTQLARAAAKRGDGGFAEIVGRLLLRAVEGGAVEPDDLSECVLALVGTMVETGRFKKAERLARSFAFESRDTAVWPRAMRLLAGTLAGMRGRRAEAKRVLAMANKAENA